MPFNTLADLPRPQPMPDLKTYEDEARIRLSKYIETNRNFQLFLENRREVKPKYLPKDTRLLLVTLRNHLYRNISTNLYKQAKRLLRLLKR